MQAYAIGDCNHKNACADCMLQLLMLYKNSICLFCNNQLKQVGMCCRYRGTPDVYIAISAINFPLW